MILLIICATIVALVGIVAGSLLVDVFLGQGGWKKKTALDEAKERLEIEKVNAQLDVVQIARDKLANARLDGTDIKELPMDVQEVIRPTTFKAKVETGADVVREKDGTRTKSIVTYCWKCTSSLVGGRCSNPACSNYGAYP